jgi:NADH-quinone oxidoreductase subunit H
MTTTGPGLIAYVAIGIVMVVGVYTVAVIDRVVGAVVAGMPVALRRTLVTPIAKAALLASQQRSSTEAPDLPGWVLAPALLAGLAAVALALVPIDEGLVVADPETGFVVFAAVIAFVMIAVYLHGWSPNSLLPLHGAYRYAAEGLSLQIPFLLAMLATALPAESLAIGDIVASQEGSWNVVRQPLGLPIYLVVGVGVAFWGPLNLPDGADLAEGTSTENAGLARLLWQLARYGMLLSVSAMGATVFLGAWHGPWLPGPVWVLTKTLLLLTVLVATRHLVARVRIERFVVVAWAVLIPLALANVFLVGGILLL